MKRVIAILFLTTMISATSVLAASEQKIGVVDIGARVSIGSSSTILYDSRVGDGVHLGPLTLVAKGERLPADTRWEGAPAAPVL